MIGNEEGQETTGLTPEMRAYFDGVSPELRFLSYLKQVPAYERSSVDFPESLDLSFFETPLREMANLRPRATKSPGYEEEEAEAGTTIYWDPEERKIDWAATTDNLTGQVELKTVDLWRSGKEPLLEAHTHTDGDQLLPSIADWHSLLQGDPRSSWRVIRAMVVVMPDSQLLAVATDKTPIYTPEKLGEIMTDWENREHGKVTGLSERSERRHERVRLIF